MHVTEAVPLGELPISMLAFAACSDHSNIAFVEEILPTTWDHFALCIWNEQQQVQVFCMEKAFFKILMLLTLKP